MRPLPRRRLEIPHNRTAADALSVALAEHQGTRFLTDDHKLADALTFPSQVNVLRVPH